MLSVEGQRFLVGVGMDGATVNIGEHNGLKGQLYRGCSGAGAMPIV